MMSLSSDGFSARVEEKGSPAIYLCDVSRLRSLDPGELSPIQKKLFDEIAGPRGGTVAGPFGVWLRRPEIAERANQFGNVLRVEGKLDKRLFELMVLVVARHWSAQYEWFVHEPAARKAGVDDAVIEAIRLGSPPAFSFDDEQLVYDFVTELCESRTVSEKTYERVSAALGTDLTIELVTGVGFYTLAAMMINVFDAPVPNGARPLPPASS
jgi:4-carboxymuconolactone decarboxylase